MNELLQQEVAVLLATRDSENCQSLEELSQGVEASIEAVQENMDSLIQKGILEEILHFDGIRYGYAGNDAQRVYLDIHRLEE